MNRNKKIIQDLQNLFSSKVSILPSDLEVASKDESSFTPVLPVAVVKLNSTEEISTLVKFCAKNALPITTRGAGSALEGNTIPTPHGIVLDLSLMNQIIELDTENLQVTVEAGIVYDQLNSVLKKDGLFFPPSPGGSSDVATIGGMISTNASGIYSVKYGGTKENLLALEVVTGTGEVLNIGNKCMKRSSGYNITDLVCGSEGTLAIISKATLRLRGLPFVKKQIAFQFQDEITTVSSVAQIRAMELDVAAIEYLGKTTIHALNKLNHYNLNEQPTLFIEVHSSNEAVNEIIQDVSMICKENGGNELTLRIGQNPWEIRHYTTPAIKLYQPNWKIFRNDVAFPVSFLPTVIKNLYDWLEQIKREESDIELFTLGHCGLGILHALIVANPEIERSLQTAQSLNKRLKEYVLTIGGTLSGEHGIGIGNKDLFLKEHQNAVQIMKSIKNVFDPYSILNPDKIFP